MARRSALAGEAGAMDGGPQAPWQAAAYKPLYALLADHLEARIVSGQFPEGAYLPGMRDMMRQFGVSLATVRGALGVLRRKGLIVVRHGSGIRAIFKGPGPKAERRADPIDVRGDIRALFALRGILEPAALESALPRMDGKALGELYATTLPNSRQEVFAVDKRMHDEIYARCANVYIRHALAEVMKQIELYREINFRRFYSRDSAGDYRTIGAIVRAIEAGDRERATGKLREHIAQTRDRLLRFISRGKSEA